MVDAQRARKMADRIHEIVARRLERGIKDPRLGFVTITDVKVTGDLQHASVFYTVYGTDEERADTGAALKSATGMLLTPSLEFILDALPENAASIDRLLQEARQRDQDSQTVAATAEYAGDADPYVKPRDEDDYDDDLDDDDDDTDEVVPVVDEADVESGAVDDGTVEPDGSTR